jgi:hypothetical protein
MLLKPRCVLQLIDAAEKKLEGTTRTFDCVGLNVRPPSEVIAEILKDCKIHEGPPPLSIGSTN